MTCGAHVLYAMHMSKMVQVRNVPDRMHSILRERAAREGLSLSDYIKGELQRITEKPSMKEWLDFTAQAKPIVTKHTAAEIIRELRDAG